MSCNNGTCNIFPHNSFFCFFVVVFLVFYIFVCLFFSFIFIFKYFCFIFCVFFIFLHFSIVCYSIHFLIFYLILMHCACMLSSSRFGTLQIILFIYANYTHITDIHVMSLDHNAIITKYISSTQLIIIS